MYMRIEKVRYSCMPKYSTSGKRALVGGADWTPPTSH